MVSLNFYNKNKGQIVLFANIYLLVTCLIVRSAGFNCPDHIKDNVCLLDQIKLLVGIGCYSIQASLSLELLILHPLKKICSLNCPLHLCPALLNIFQTFGKLPVEIILMYINIVTDFFFIA